MSGTVLQSYLISLKYQVDAASQRSFLQGLANAVKGVGGMTGAVVGLSAAIVAMARSMASANDQMYWLSRRAGSSVRDIESMNAAMAQLGVSSEEAASSMEGLRRFVATTGPGAVNFLRSLGVTATDTVGRMRQLSTFFSRGGQVENQGTQRYALLAQYAALLGISEKTMNALASGELEKQQQRALQILRDASGLGDKDRQKTISQSHELMNLFRRFGVMLDGFRQRFESRFLPRFSEQLERIFKIISDHAPQIQRFLDRSADALVIFVTEIGNMIELLGKLDPAVVHFGEVVAAAFGARMLLKSPLLMALTAAVLLLDDYMHYLQTPNKQGENYLLPWDKLGEMKKGIDDWAESTLGIKDGFWSIAGALVAVLFLLPKVIGFTRLLGGLLGLAPAAGRGLAGLVSRFPLLAALLQLFATRGDSADPRQGRPATPEELEAAKKKQAEINKSHGYTGNLWHDMWQMLFGSSPQDDMQKSKKVQTESVGYLRGILEAMQAMLAKMTGGDQTGGDTEEFDKDAPRPGFWNWITGGQAISSEEEKANARSALGAITKRGYPMASAMGMISNWVAESHLNPGAHNASGHGGIEQWSRERQGRYTAMHPGKRLQDASFDDQVQFAMDELEKYYPEVAAALKRGDITPDQALDLFLDRIESPARPGTPEYAKELANRRGILRQLQTPGKLLPSGASTGTGAPQGGAQHSALSQSTNITVSGAGDPHAVANRVAFAQGRVNEGLVRSLRPAYT